MKIYVVVGQRGEYSDRREWMVRAFTDQARAEEHAVKAKARADELLHLYGADGWVEGVEPPINEYDLQDEYGAYDEAGYWAEELELEE